MPINPNANRNAITQTLMNIQNPPPRQLPPQGARGGPQQMRPPTMSPPPPPQPQMPGMAPAMTQGINALAGGPQPGQPRVPLAQVPGQMMNNLQQAPQRVANLFTQGVSPGAAAPLEPDPLQQQQPY